MDRECCGTCKYHKRDEHFEDDWICCNSDSEYVTEWTPYDFCCDEHEERE